MEENKENKIRVEIKQDTATGFFVTLTQAAKKAGFFWTLFALIVFVLLYSFVIHPVDLNRVIEKAIENKEEKTKTEHYEDIQLSKRDNIEINNLFSKLVSDEKIDRVILFQLHDGTSNLNGVPFVKFSATNEVVAEQITEYIGDQFYDQILGSYEFLLRRLSANGFVYSGSVQKESEKNKIYMRMTKNNAQSVYIRSIYNDQTDMVAFLLIESESEDSFTLEEIQKATAPVSARLTELLCESGNLTKKNPKNSRR
jgi:hypothetical protein